MKNCIAEPVKAGDYQTATRDIKPMRSASVSRFGVRPFLRAFTVEPDGLGARLIFERDRTRRRVALWPPLPVAR